MNGDVCSYIYICVLHGRNQATATDATDPGYALPRLEDLLSSIAKLDNDHGQSQSEEHLFSARTNV